MNLLDLPDCPIVKCGRCAREFPEAGGWLSKDLGCETCSPENAEAMMLLASSRSEASYFKDVLRDLLASLAAGNPRATEALVRRIRKHAGELFPDATLDRSLS